MDSMELTQNTLIYFLQIGRPGDATPKDEKEKQAAAAT
jgi:hypothetical protein